MKVAHGLSLSLRAGLQRWLELFHVTRYGVTRYPVESMPMADAAQRMKLMRERRRTRGLRELRLVVPDARSKVVRGRVARQVARLDRSRESEAIRWTELVSEFDAR